MRVVVTGGKGFLGRYTVRALEAKGHDVYAATSGKYDLRKRLDCAALMADQHPDAVVHLAARVGGIGDNYERPGIFVYENAVMGLELMEAARKAGVEKFLTTGTACMYPAEARIPMKEVDIWNGRPAFETVSYADAKRLVLAQGQAYQEQYDFNAIMVIPSNLYGPEDRSTHVVPSLIRKFLYATQHNEDAVTLWGTGNASRDFLYVEDAAEGIALALDHYEGYEPLNLGSGIEVPIFGLARTTAAMMEYEGDIRWDITKPEGTRRRCLDTTKASQKIGWYAAVSLKDGLDRTINWQISGGEM